MKKIALYGKPAPNRLNSDLPSLMELVKSYGFEAVVYERFAAYLVAEGILEGNEPTFNRDSVRINEYAFLISVGGDGTLLDTATLLRDSGVPVIGVNAGRLGFISSATLDEIGGVCASFRNDTLRWEARSLLKLDAEKAYFGETNFALNEFTVLKKDTAAMIRIDVWLDDDFLNSYWADGLIVSTPTGSTAYSLSCGGPIIMPGSQNFVITPIAPHNLNVRPVVVSHDTRIRISVSGRSEHFLIALDSRPAELLPHEIIELTRAPFDLRLIQPEGHSFLNTLRNKLAWGYDKRN